MAPYLFISIFFIAYGVFGFYPTLYGLWLSFQGGIDHFTFVGFKHYIEVFHDALFWQSMWNGTKMALASLLIITPLAMGVAILINQRRIAKYKGFFATFFFTPNITSAVAVGVIFSLIFDPSVGMLNRLIGLFGLPSVQWLQDPHWTMPSLVIVIIWRALGINILYCLAGLQNVSQDLGEAAKIDGANSFQSFWHITLPAMRPVMAFIVFQAILGSYNMFTEAFVLAGKGFGPADSLVFPTTYLYQQAFQAENYGYSAAVGWVFTLILVIIGIVQLKFFRLREEN
jgi:ABC-type sugar transport system permease subunit